MTCIHFDGIKFYLRHLEVFQLWDRQHAAGPPVTDFLHQGFTWTHKMDLFPLNYHLFISQQHSHKPAKINQNKLNSEK